MSATTRKRNVTLLDEAEDQVDNASSSPSARQKNSSTSPQGAARGRGDDDPRLRSFPDQHQQQMMTRGNSFNKRNQNVTSDEESSDHFDDDNSSVSSSDGGTHHQHHHHHRSPRNNTATAKNSSLRGNSDAMAASLLSAAHTTPFESLVTQYEAASNHLPANVGGRFQDAVFPGSQQLALLLEQWISAEGLSSGGHGHKNNNIQQRRQLSSLPNDDSSNMNTGALLLFSSSSSSSVGLSNAAKARLRNLLEQGLTDFVQRLQLNVLSEIEVVNAASSQVVTRGGILSHQFDSTQQELTAARKEIARTHQAADEQNKRMIELEATSKLREEQFDLIRQQLSSREEMLRESTTSFRKELNRFRSRIVELEAEADRRRMSPVPVVGHWGFRNSQDQGNNNNATFAGSLRPHQSMSPQNTLNNNNNGRMVSAEPDPRGILAAAASMDQLGNNNSTFSQSPTTTQYNNNNSNHNQFMENFSFTAGVGGGGDANTTSNNNNSVARSVFGSPDDNFFSPSSLSIPRIIQVASEVGMQEAVLEMKREFDKKMKAVKERFMQDKRESLAQLKSKQDLTLLQLQRDVQEKEKELIELREFVRNNNSHNTNLGLQPVTPQKSQNNQNIESHVSKENNNSNAVVAVNSESAKSETAKSSKKKSSVAKKATKK